MLLLLSGFCLVQGDVNAQFVDFMRMYGMAFELMYLSGGCDLRFQQIGHHKVTAIRLRVMVGWTTSWAGSTRRSSRRAFP